MVIMILLLSFMPNSPRFLLSRGRDTEALQALAWLRGANADIRWEFQQIQDNVQRQVQEGGHPAMCGHGQSPGLSESCLLFLKNWNTSIPTSRCQGT